MGKAMNKTKISWAESTWNPVIGCSKISEACDHCYAERMARRLAAMGHDEYEGFKVRCLPKRLDEPLRMKKGRTIFVCSMGDLFHHDVPTQFIDRVFATMALSPRHRFMLLTKRPERMEKFLYRDCNALKEFNIPWPFTNVWLGVTAENQKWADERIPLLLSIPAAHHWVSVEPMLGDLNFRWKPYHHQATSETYRQYLERTGSVSEYESLKMLDLVVCGGETGPYARPMNPQWVRSLRDQCAAADVPFHFKAWGEWGITNTYGIAHPTYAGQMIPFTTVASTERRSIDETSWYCFPPDSNGDIRELEVMRHVGKKRAGRLLDGREHNGDSQ
jgi:protein gp37